MNDKKYMQIAIDQAKDASFPFGAVIIKDNNVLSVGQSGENPLDPTSHAEINAIRKASEKLQSKNLSGCTIYTTCEPCPMCFGAIYWSKIDNVVSGISLEESVELFDGEILISNEEINEKSPRKINIKKGLLSQEVKDLFS